MDFMLSGKNKQYANWLSCRYFWRTSIWKGGWFLLSITCSNQHQQLWWEHQNTHWWSRLGFWEARWHLMTKSLGLPVKIRLCESIILAVLLYSAEMWPVMEVNQKRL